MQYIINNGVLITLKQLQLVNSDYFKFIGNEKFGCDVLCKMIESEKVYHVITGKVVSNKMDKSITVKVERLIKHPLYGKYLKRSSKVMAHDEKNECNEGDFVEILPNRPLSKKKNLMS